MLQVWHQQGASVQVRFPAVPNYHQRGSHDLSSLPFSAAAGRSIGAGARPCCVAGVKSVCVRVCVRMCVCLCRGQGGASCLCALSFFMLPALIFPLIPLSHTLPEPRAAGLQYTDGGAVKGELKERG